ncbi:MAG: hypothetical protein ABJB66_00640 [Gemmatimonadaceae bacterium]
MRSRLAVLSFSISAALLGACAHVPLTLEGSRADAQVSATVSARSAVARTAADSAPVAARARADSAHTFFYFGKDYGSESQYNPLTVVLNDGFDILQISGSDNRVFKFDYVGSFTNVARALSHPFHDIREFGTSKFLTHEIFPLSGAPDGGQWEPNYTEHLIGGGMQVARTKEWYIAHEYKHPLIWTSVTVAASRFLNETMENGTWRGPGTDPIADLYVFDLGGALLFTNERVEKFFSHTLNLTSWSGQPSIDPADGRLFDVYTSWSFKVKLPYVKRVSFFGYNGENPLAGLSYRTEKGDAFSAGYGATVTDLVVVDSINNRKGVHVRPSAGFFWDRNGSLMVSAVYAERPYHLSVNIYPHVIHIGRLSPGFWMQLPTEGGVRLGLAGTLLPGLIKTFGNR